MRIADLIAGALHVEILAGSSVYTGAEAEELHSVSIYEAMLGMVDAVFVDGVVYRPVDFVWVRK